MGLKNLGNTCYANSTIQCLKKVKELAEDLQNTRGAINRTDKQLSFLVALKDCYRMLETNGEAVRPLNLIVVLITVIL